MTPDTIIQITIGLLAGALLGAGYFALLHHSVRQFETAASAGRIVGMALLRIAIAAVVFLGLVQLGAWALVAGLAGFLITRMLARRWVEA